MEVAVVADMVQRNNFKAMVCPIAQSLEKKVGEWWSMLLERREYSERPLRYEYVLTALGKGFQLLALMRWGNKHTVPPPASTSNCGPKQLPIIINLKLPSRTHRCYAQPTQSRKSEDHRYAYSV